jgi:hypothetical protein
MQWVSVKNRSGSLQHRLEMAEPVDLNSAYTEFWRRILSDGIALLGKAEWRAIAFELSPRQVPADGPGELIAHFWDASNRRLGQPGYFLRSETFVALEGDDSDEKHARDLLMLYLLEYGRLRTVAAIEPVKSLFRQTCSQRSVEVVGAVNDGWLDLQIGQPEPGPLPEYDRQLLAGVPAQRQPDLAGLFDMEWLSLLNNVGNALIHYTPPHFKTIECTVRVEGNRLFYQIGCPDFPDEGTTEPGKDVHEAMSRLIAYKLKSGAAFPGMRFVVQIQPDGTARTHAEILS